jgi:ketosteroid isomerase-like protein
MTSEHPLTSAELEIQSRARLTPRMATGTGEEIAGRLFDAFNRRDLESALELLHPDVVFQPVSGAILHDGQPYRGHEGMRRYFADVQTHWRELQVTPLQVRAAGDAVVALGETNGRGPAVPLIDAPTTWVFKFKNGLAAHIQIFSDERLARQALAADEPPSEISQVGPPAEWAIAGR